MKSISSLQNDWIFIIPSLAIYISGKTANIKIMAPSILIITNQRSNLSVTMGKTKWTVMQVIFTTQKTNVTPVGWLSTVITNCELNQIANKGILTFQTWIMKVNCSIDKVIKQRKLIIGRLSLSSDIPRRRTVFSLVSPCCPTPKTRVSPLEFICYHVYELAEIYVISNVLQVLSRHIGYLVGATLVLTLPSCSPAICRESNYCVSVNS